VLLLLSPSPFDGPVGGKQSFVTRHAFAEGFDATRALVRAVAAARADGTLMSVARPRGGAGNANGGVKGTGHRDALRAETTIEAQA
jgi:hypothetical protein